LKTVTSSSILTVLLIFFSVPVFAQSSTSSNSLLLSGLIIVSVVLVLWALLTLANNLMRIEAAKNGIDTVKYGFSVIPGISDFIQGFPGYIKNAKFVQLGKGHDILLEGEAKKEIQSVRINRFAIKPTDFHGMSPIPKVVVEIGQSVKAGDPIFCDKKRETIQYCAPVSGEIVAIERGEKRAITAVVILADKTQQYKSFNTPNTDTSGRDALVDFLLESGLWTMINERPFDRVPDPDTIPVNIFISTFDTAPLAPDLNYIVEGQEKAFQKGLDVLTKLTSGKVHVGLDGRDRKKAPHAAFLNAAGVEKTFFAGKHPAGNVGIQIHHVAPIKQGQSVWTLGVQDVISIGKMFLEGKYDAGRIVAVTGAELKNPVYIKTFQGCHIGDLLQNNLTNKEVRIISGDVLSGAKISLDGFLGFRDDQVTAVREGNQYELFGWLLPLSPRPSLSRTFPNFLYPNHKFEAETNTHGEKRAMVVTGQYDEVLPVDTYPQHLFKAILTNDMEKMENLGILELTEEDVALCEFVCTSKTPIQKILRQGLESIKEQS
jgi:Na+-transporting NADH:ubiquinone oxidoreductase subunit A